MDSIDKSFLAHLFIECYFNPNKGLIEEAFFNERKVLFEEYGLFRGCDKLSEYILDYISDINVYPDQSQIVNIKIDNSGFIDTITILLYNSQNGNTASYVPNRSVLVNSNGNVKFSPAYLTINKNKGIKLSVIIHELTHAYEDYNRRVNKAETVSDKSLKLGYAKIANEDVLNFYDRLAKESLYRISSFEKNAFVAQIAGECIEKETPCLTVKEAYDFIRGSKTYKNYKILMDNLKLLYEDDLQDTPYTLEGFMDSFMRFSNYKFKTVSQFRKFCKNKAYKIERKFNNIIPKIIYKYLMVSHELPPNVDSESQSIK